MLVTAERLTIRTGGAIGSSSALSSEGGGTVTVSAKEIELLDGGGISTGTSLGGGTLALSWSERNDCLSAVLILIPSSRDKRGSEAQHRAILPVMLERF